MVRLCLGLIPLALLISLPLTALLIRLGHRMGTFDSAGVPGQVKLEHRRVPNTGGIAIFWAIALPVIAGLALVGPAGRAPATDHADPSLLPADLREHVKGIAEQAPLALWLLGSLLLLHVMGLIDDRRPLGPRLKLAIMALPAVLLPLLSERTRLVTVLDAHVGGPWLTIAITALWFLVVTNAMNFMDNMDGVSAGVAAVAAACFLAATLVSAVPQWFIAAMLALIIGACLGFLVFNFPRRGGARIYMGDGGSLVLGFLLAFLTVRTTYYDPQHSPSAGGWYGVFMPLVVLAVPLYDFASVTSLRLSQGRSPFVGDTQHLSHRLERLGLPRAFAVLVIYGMTAATGISGIVLGSLRPWQAVLVGIQTIVILLVIALFEFSRSRPNTPV